MEAIHALRVVHFNPLLLVHLFPLQGQLNGYAPFYEPHKTINSRNDILLRLLMYLQTKRTVPDV